jgi:hypothetical protein
MGRCCARDHSVVDNLAAPTCQTAIKEPQAQGIASLSIGSCPRERTHMEVAKRLMLGLARVLEATTQPWPYRTTNHTISCSWHWQLSRPLKVSNFEGWKQHPHPSDKSKPLTTITQLLFPALHQTNRSLKTKAGEWKARKLLSRITAQPRMQEDLTPPVKLL